MQKLKKIILCLCCVPLVLLCSCSSDIDAVDVSYYFADAVTSTFFSDSSTRSLTISDLASKKVNTDLLDDYCSLTLEEATDVSRTYHLYIDKIVFYVYTNESSDYDFNISITIDNVIFETEVGSESSDTTFSETYSGKASAKKSIKFEVEVNRVVSSATGCSITFDITNSEIYNTTETVTFKWLLYNLKIYAEPRTYNS